MPAAHGSSSPADVLVIGGGLVGLCSAYSLTRAGYSVTILDRDRLGSGAAQGNAGEITPLNVLPLSGPGMLHETVRGVFSQRHYLSIAPRALLELSTFGLSFLAHCARSRVASSTRALDQLARGIFSSFDAYASDGIALQGGGSGYVYTHTDITKLTNFHNAIAARADLLGVARPEPVLMGDALHETEPALSTETPAGFIASTERYLDPRLFVAALRAGLEAEGTQIREGVEVTRLDPGATRPTVELRSARGTERIAASRIVLAGGAWTSQVLARSGYRVPSRLRVVPGRGYSFTVGTDTMPRLLLGALDQRTVAIPMNGRLRIAGLMDFDGTPTRFEPHRAAHLASRAARFLRGVDWDDISEQWVGPRPMTASGLPVISPLPNDDRIVVAAGHNMHGLSLGPLTGELVTSLISGSASRIAGKNIDMRPFALK